MSEQLTAPPSSPAPAQPERDAASSAEVRALRIVVAAAGASSLVAGGVAATTAAGDWVWFPVGAVLLAGAAAAGRRRHALAVAVGLAAVVLTAWAGVSEAPWGAERAPLWLEPRGLTDARWLALTALLAAWLALEWWGAHRGHGRAGWTLALVAALAVARVWPLAAHVIEDWILGDEGTILGVAWRMLHGEHLYTDRFEFLWPGSFLLTAALFAVTGVKILTVQVATTVLLALCTVLAFLCVRRDAGTPAALACALLVLTAVAPEPVWWSPHWMTTATGLTATWLLMRREPPWPWPTALLAGLALGASMLIQQHKGGALLGCVGGAVLVLALYVWARDGRAAAAPYGRAVGVGLAGVALAIGPVLGWIVLRGDFAAFRYATWTWLFEGYGPANRVQPDYFFPFNLELPLPRLLLWLWHEGSYTVAHGAALLLPPAALLWALPRRPEQPRWRYGILLAGTLGAFSAAALRYEYYRLVYVAPATCALAVAGIARVWHRLRPPHWLRLGAPAAAVLLVGSMAAHAWRWHLLELASHPWLALPDTAMGPLTITFYSGEERPADVAELMQVLGAMPKTEEFFVYPVGGGYYLMTGRPNPTRYFFLLPGYNRPHQVDEVIQTLDRKRVRYFIWDRAYEKWLQSVYPFLPPKVAEQNDLMAYVRSHYYPIIERPTLTVYARHDRAQPSASGPGATP